MKKLFFLTLTAFTLFSCNSGANNVIVDEHAGHNHEAEEAPIANAEVIPLNNGAKWKADKATSQNVAELKTIAETFKLKVTPDLKDYQELNGEFARALNKMIQQCTMSGPDHDALHVWLEPVLKDNAKLKESSDVTASHDIFLSIDKRINNYQNYFEQL